MGEFEVNLQALIRQIRAEQYEIKVHALASMYEFLRDNIVPFSVFEDEFDDLFESIFHEVVYCKYKSDHDLALAVICVLSLSYGDLIEDNVVDFIKRLIPEFENATNKNTFMFFAIAFSMAFSVDNDELCEKLFSEYIELILNKKGRPMRLSPMSVSYIFTGLNLLMSIFSAKYATETFKSDLEAVIIQGIHSAHADIVRPAIEMAGVIYESYLNQERNYYMQEDQSRLFAMQFLKKLEESGDRIGKKSESKSIKACLLQVQGFLQGKETFVKYKFLEQEIKFNNIQSQIIINCIKDILKTGFQMHMIKNSLIQSILEYRLAPLREGIINSKTIRKIQQSREVKKDRDQDREKKRKQKEERMEDDHF